MPDVVRLPVRLDCTRGLDLVSAPDRCPPGSFLQLTNARVVTEGTISGRPGYSQYGNPAPSPQLLHSIRRLNDATVGNGYSYVVGNGTTLDVGPETALAQVDAGYSGNPLSILTFRPENSPESWAYCYDANKQSKVKADGTLRAIGVVPPNAAPTCEYGIPAWVQVASGQDQSPYTGWAATGIDTGPTTQDRTAGDTDTIGNIIYDSGTTGWCCIQANSGFPSWFGNRMQLSLNPSNTGHTNAEVVVVRDVINAILSPTTIAAIQYDSGTSGLASVVLTGNPAGLQRDSLLQFLGGGGNELVRVLSVTLSPDGSVYSCRVKLANLHAVGATVNGEQSWRVYTVNQHFSGEAFVSNYLQFGHAAAGVGAGTYTPASAINASVANGRPIDTANDYMHVSLYLNDPAVVVNVQVMLCFDAVPNFSFTNPGNALVWTATQTTLVLQGSSGGSWVDLVLPISEAVTTGNSPGLGIQSITGVAIQMTSTGACTWGFDWFYLFGTYGPVIQPNSPAGYFYDSRFRDSTTGAPSVPGPTTRFSMYPLREDVIVTPATTTAAGVDTSDIYREGGNITQFVYIGSVANNISSPNSFDDGLADETIENNTPVDLTVLQPWPTLGLPLAGVINVSGTSVSWVSGSIFPVALVANSVILINGVSYLTRGQPHSGTFLELELDAGVLTNAAYEIQSPTLAGQPLPVAFGPLEGPYAPVSFALGDPINGGTLYWSNTSNLDGASDENSLELCGPGEPLISGEVWNGVVLAGSRENVYMTRSSFLQSSGSSPYQYSRLPAPSGFWSRWTVCRGPDGVYALGRDGIYKWSEQGGVNITDAQLYPLFPHDGHPASAVNGYYPVDMTQINFMRMSYLDQEIGFIYLDTNGSQMEMRLEIARNRWFIHQYAGPLAYKYLNEPSVADPNNLSILALSRTLGLIYQAGGNTDAGAAITTTVQLPYLDGGDERAQKLHVDYMVDADQTGTLATQEFYNNGTSSLALSNIFLTGPRVQSLVNASSVPAQLNLYRNVSLLMTWQGGPAGPRVYSFEPAWYAQPYLSMRVTTQYFGLAFPGWKSHRRIFPGIISVAPVILTIRTVDGRQFTVTIPSTNGQFNIVPQMVPQCAKALAFAYMLDGGGSEFALFPDEFSIEIKEWSESSFIKLNVFKT